MNMIIANTLGEGNEIVRQQSMIKIVSARYPMNNAISCKGLHCKISKMLVEVGILNFS